MAFTPTDVANRSLDAVGAGFTIGDLEEGTEVAQIVLRHYNECLQQLLRACHWQFARKQEPMLMLADATGQTPSVGTLVPGSQFLYEYQWPIDCLKIIYVPSYPQGVVPPIPSGNIQLANPGQQTTGQNFPPYTGFRPSPAPYLVTQDPNYPPPAGSQTWEVLGSSPAGSTVILTNIYRAQLVYVALSIYPSQWDALFRAAMVAYLASEVALPIWTKKDRKFGLQIRNQQIAVAKAKITEARVADGNDTWAKNDIPVDWMRARRTGGSNFWGAGGTTYGAGPASGGYGGYGNFGWDSCGFADGSAF